MPTTSKLVAAVISLLPLGLFADTLPPLLPALYNAKDVADDDVLNIRAAPDAESEIIGTLPHDATGVEGVDFSAEGRWAMVSRGDFAGWVSLRFLQAMPLRTGATGLPVKLRCFGTEPFWSIRFREDTLSFRTPETEAQYEMLDVSPALTHVDLRETGALLSWMVEGRTVTARILPGMCSDGMSDAAYALHYVDDLMPNAGCCSIAGR
ncbi:MAG: hypothetical protein AAGG57_03585 [Pseudomonadota bacterium]